MKNNKWLSLLAPVALMALGLVLFFVPDTGSILLSKILGWGLTLVGILAIFWTVFAREWRKLAIGIVLVCVGSVLLAKPLALAAFVGRILGVVLAFRGIVEWSQSANRQGKLLCVAVTLVGVILILMPMSASRLVFSLCGLVLVICGVMMLVQRLRQQRYLPKNRDDIIDAL